ncbi:hypothetical protein FSPOR_8625 [Fusarium sporotrichioides]|uniref:Uncharacterized protein n=1 Tax=Fusarium sporotrichioides TaxID=5514 RepID=A0A395RTU7_FUSSP|nr:hypothetical protein FSPOR_8625 [Fusarium sporotrichioides]
MMDVFENPPVTLMSSATRAVFGRSDETHEHCIRSHENATEPSEAFNYRKIAKDHRGDAIVKRALKNCKGVTFGAVDSQVCSGQKISFNNLKRGDVVLLCTSHPTYGQCARRCMYWGNTSVDGDERLVFLALVTYGRGGVKKSPYWFLKHVSYKLQSREFLASKAFVSWTQAVVIKPKHDYIVGIREPPEATSEYFSALEFIEHLLKSHAELISYLSALNHNATSSPDKEKRSDEYGKIRDSLNLLTSKFCPRACGVNGALRNELGKYQKNEKWSDKDFSISPYSPDCKPNSGKCQPPENFCELLTGQVERFCAKNHKIIGN